jgi:hypothetical protein
VKRSAIKAAPVALLCSLPAVVAPAATAQAVGVRCEDVRAGGYAATHVFADFMPCRSARAKLRRWLPRDSLPRNPSGWYCYRLTGRVRACTYPGRLGLADPKSFTFWLRRSGAAATAPIRECGDVNRSIYNVTSRVVSCRTARRLVRRLVILPGCTEDRYCHYRGWRCTQYGYRIPRGYETDSRCTKPGGRVVRYQYGSGGSV